MGRVKEKHVRKNVVVSIKRSIPCTFTKEFFISHVDLLIFSSLYFASTRTTTSLEAEEPRPRPPVSPRTY